MYQSSLDVVEASAGQSEKWNMPHAQQLDYGVEGHGHTVGMNH
jgi:hypothetical protein